MRALFVFIMAATVLSLDTTVHAKVIITINKSAQRMTVSADGVPLYKWPVSTGRAGRDTPSGKFRAFRLEKDHYSREWDDAPMPHSIFFTQDGHAIHGSYDTQKIGSPASAGCVRLAPENAETLFVLVKEQGVLNTTVKVVGDLQIALGRPSSQSASTQAGANVTPRRRGRAPTYREPMPPRGYYGDAPSQGHYVVPYGGPYSLRPPARYAPPPRYYERQPDPRYYRW